MNILLTGGGIDSTALLFHLLQTVDTSTIVMVHVNYGQKAWASELRSVEYFAAKYGVRVVGLSVDLSFSNSAIMRGATSDNQLGNRLELRNLVLISLASSWAASNFERFTLFLGFHLEPENGVFADARTDFLSPLETAMSLATTQGVCISTPFHDMSRVVIFQNAIRYDSDIIQHSHTCYESVSCGQCTHCKEKADMQTLINSQP